MVDGPNTYGFCGGDPVNRVDPMGTKIEVAGEEYRMFPGELYEAGPFIRSVIKAMQDVPGEVHTWRFESRQQMVEHFKNIKIFKQYLTTLESLRMRAVEEIEYQQLQKMHERKFGTLRNPPSQITREWQALGGGVSPAVADLNRGCVAMAIPHVAVLVNGIQGTVNAVEGNYGRMTLNLAGVLLSLRPGVEMEGSLKNGSFAGTGGQAALTAAELQSMRGSYSLVADEAGRTFVKVRISRSRFTEAEIAQIEAKYAGANGRIAAGEGEATVGNNIKYNSHRSKRYVRDTLHPDQTIKETNVPKGLNVDEFISRQYGGPQETWNQHLMLERANQFLGQVEYNATKDLPLGTRVVGFILEWID